METLLSEIHRGCVESLCAPFALPTRLSDFLRLPQVISIIQEEFAPLKDLETKLFRKVKQGGTIRLEELESSFREHIEKIDCDSKACWLLAACSLCSSEEMEVKTALELVEKSELGKNPKARLEAAVNEYFKMMVSFGSEDEVGGGQVPVGYRERCIEAACLAGYSFGVRYDSKEEVYFIGTSGTSLGLENFKWGEGSGPVGGNPAYVKCKSMEELNEALRVVGAKIGYTTLDEPGTWHERLKLLMIRAIQREEGKRAKEGVEKIEQYTPSWSALREICLIAGTFNPYKAAQIVQVHFPSRGHTPPHKRKGRASFVSGAGGIVTTGDTYLLFNPESMSSQACVLGTQAFQNFFAAWNPEQVTKKKKEEVLGHRMGHIKNILQTVVEKGEESLEEEGAERREGREYDSHSVMQALELYYDLKRENAELMGDIDRARYSGLLDPSHENYVLRDLDGKQISGWFNREENFQSLPQHVQLAWKNFNDPLVSLSEADTFKLAKELALYYASRRHLSNRASSLNPYLKDIEWYNQLPKEDPLKVDLLGVLGKDMHVLTAKVRSVVETPGPITDFEIRRVYEECRIHELRERANSRVLVSKVGEVEEKRKYTGYACFSRQEFEAAMKLFMPLFIGSDNKWLSLGDSIPWAELRNHLYVKLGITRDEMRVLYKACILRKSTSSDEKFFTARPIEDFIDMVEGVIVAYRKVVGLLGEMGKEGVLPEINLRNVSESSGEGIGRLEGFLGTSEDRIRKGKHWRTVENFEEGYEPLPQGEDGVEIKHEGPRERAHKLSMNEVVHRLKARGLVFGKTWREFTSRTVQESGLYSTEKDKAQTVEGMYQDALRLIPASELANEIECYEKIVANPLIVRLPEIGYKDPKTLHKKEFFEPEEIEYIRKINLFGDDLKGMSEKLGDEVGSLADRVKVLKGTGYHEAKFLVGGLVEGEEGLRRFKVEGGDLEGINLESESLIVKREDGIWHYNAQILPEIVQNLENNFGSVTEDWKSRALALVGLAKKRELALGGLLPGERESFFRIKNLRPNHDRVHIDLIELVDSEHKKIFESKPGVPTSGAIQNPVPLRWIKWEKGDPVIDFGKEHKGENFIQVTVQDPGYIRYMRRMIWDKYKAQDYAHLNRIAKRIIEQHFKEERAGYVFKDPQGFREWVAQGAL